MSAQIVTMEELELERAELLPNRETLCSGGNYNPGYSVSQWGNGNNAQSGWFDFNISNVSIANWGNGNS